MTRRPARRLLPDALRVYWTQPMALSREETRVLSKIAEEGMSYRQAAAQLDVTVHKVFRCVARVAGRLHETPNDGGSLGECKETLVQGLRHDPS